MCSASATVDVRLPGKGNSNSHGARPGHLIITMIKRVRTSRLSIKNRNTAGRGGGGVRRGAERAPRPPRRRGLLLLYYSLELSDTKVYEPQIRALLGTASHFCEAVVLRLRTVPISLRTLRVIRRGAHAMYKRGATVCVCVCMCMCMCVCVCVCVCVTPLVSEEVQRERHARRAAEVSSSYTKVYSVIYDSIRNPESGPLNPKLQAQNPKPSSPRSQNPNPQPPNTSP